MKNKVPTLPLDKRKSTFKEVELGYTKEQAIAEANRCLQCPEPNCVKGCPAGVDIPGFIKAFREGDLNKAASIIREKNFFPSVCGRICQHEKQCEGNCILAKANMEVCVGGIERYIGDNSEFPKFDLKNTDKKAAIIGSGPSGLTAAAYLAKAGVNVTVLEGTNSFGGVIKYGVPDFRLPKDIIKKELFNLISLGIDFEPNAKVDGRSLEEIADKYDVVFLGTGVGKTRELKVPGHELRGVSSAIKLLVSLNQSGLPLISQGENVLVVGAGYVGIDAARSAVRLGASNVTCVTIDSEEDAKKRVTKKDFEEAEVEGVNFIFDQVVSKFEGTDKVERVYCSLKTDQEVKTSFDVDKVIVAIGQEHDHDSYKDTLETKDDGAILVNEYNQTRRKNIFAAGDCVHGPKTVIYAVATGRESAKAMLYYLENFVDKKDEEKPEEEKSE